MIYVEGLDLVDRALNQNATEGIFAGWVAVHGSVPAIEDVADSAHTGFYVADKKADLGRGWGMPGDAKRMRGEYETSSAAERRRGGAALAVRDFNTPPEGGDAWLTAFLKVLKRAVQNLSDTERARTLFHTTSAGQVRVKFEKDK